MSTMSDRELLELAAKAYWPNDEASTRYDEKEGGLLYIHADNQDHNGHDREYVWDPINDDGDRLRLARALKMCIDYADCSVSSRYGGWLAQEWWGGDSGDEAHAVLRVAAEIGKVM